MILFSQKSHEDIKKGKITLAFRAWNTLNLQKNRIYKSYNIGLLRVLDVTFKKTAEVTMSEVKKCGFKSLRAFKDGYEEDAKREVDFKTETAVRIEFEYLGEEIESKKRPMGKVTLMELYSIKQKISAMEEKSGSPWIVKILRSLSRNGSTDSKDLQKLLRTSPDKIRVNIRTLRELNLIYGSGRKGFSITPLSSKLLKISDV